MAYPATLDNLSHIVDRTLLGGVWTPGSKWQADVVNPWIDAINAIESTLGINPQGTYPTVAARLDDIAVPNHNRLHDILSTSDHNASGLTTGYFMKATGPTTFAFVAHGLVAADVGAAPLVHDHGTGTDGRIVRFDSGGDGTLTNSILSDNGTLVSGTGRFEMTYGAANDAIKGVNTSTGNGVVGGSTFGKAGRFYQSGTLTGIISNNVLLVERQIDINGFDDTGSVLLINDESEAVGNIIEIKKYNSLGTIHTVYDLNLVDGLSFTESRYLYYSSAWHNFTIKGSGNKIGFWWDVTEFAAFTANRFQLNSCLDLLIDPSIDCTPAAGRATIYVEDYAGEDNPVYWSLSMGKRPFVVCEEGKLSGIGRIPYVSNAYTFDSAPMEYNDSDGYIQLLANLNFHKGYGGSLINFVGDEKTFLHLNTAVADDSIYFGHVHGAWGTKLFLYSGTDIEFHTNNAASALTKVLTLSAAGTATFENEVFCPSTRITRQGGIAVKFTAGENLYEGECVACIIGSTSQRVYKAPASGAEMSMPVGFVYADAASGNEVWVVVSGKCYVKPESGVTLTYGYLIYTSDSEAGRVKQSATIPTDADHFRECGHVYQNGSGNGQLAYAIVHFN